MGEYRFSFENEQQRHWYEQYKEQIRTWDWERIRAVVVDHGEYVLGPAKELEPARGKAPQDQTRVEREQQAGWVQAMLQVILLEQHLSWGHDTDPQTRADIVVIQASHWPLPASLRFLADEEGDDDGAEEGP